MTSSHSRRSACTTSGEIEFAGGRSSQAIAVVAPRLELDRAVLPARVRARVGEEALARLDAEPALGDEPAQDRRRLEVARPTRRRALEPGQHLVEPELVGALRTAAA